MAKLKLDLDDLRVQSFQTTPGGPASRGTVQAFSGTEYTDCWGTCSYASSLCGTETCNSGPQTEECNSMEPECSDCHECTGYGDCTLYVDCTQVPADCTEGNCLF